MCFFRRSELSPALQGQADKHHWGDSNFESADPDSDDEDQMVKDKDERRAFKLREVFLSRQVETLPATLIRGKCSVTLLSEVETVASYTGTCLCVCEGGGGRPTRDGSLCLKYTEAPEFTCQLINCS